MKDKHEPVQAVWLEVIPKYGESFEKTIKRFLKKVRNDGILQEVFEKSYFESPSKKRKRKSAKAQYLLKKEQEKQKKF